ncbi:hypothetical protein ANTRET_LOCUS5124 [Anthophora retusa]
MSIALEIFNWAKLLPEDCFRNINQCDSGSKTALLRNFVESGVCRLEANGLPRNLDLSTDLNFPFAEPPTPPSG